ncbi:hypothetical protein [Endozoicomonas arenosclerae]|uniref:hypothetical protein n=1 Tax=Endozoicomonas arenosclerae TaxID=1633495 RepID=UPI000783C74D|nr:hypothetical protein [Endozoicomonas arenosclerae]
MLMTLQNLLGQSPEWMALLVLIAAVLPLILLPAVFLGLLGARQKNKVRAYLRFMYLFLPWLPFAALAGLYMMSVANITLGLITGLAFVAVRLYFVFANASNNGLNASLRVA